MMDPIQRAVAKPPRKIVMQRAARQKVFIRRFYFGIKIVRGLLAAQILVAPNAALTRSGVIGY
jgi:hypothetical protein